MSRLQQLFHHLQKAGLKVNLKNGKLGLSELAYLGYILGGGHLKPQTKKLKAILQAARPCTKKQLRQFLGLVGCYSCFIPNFATIAAALTNRQGKQRPDSLV